jgi:hypothetical protein
LTSTKKHFEPSLNLHVQLLAFPTSCDVGSPEKGIYEDIFIPSNYQTLVPNLKSYFLKPQIFALVPIWDGWQQFPKVMGSRWSKNDFIV